MTQKLVLAVLMVPGLLGTRSARAADPTKVECVAANDAAQDLRRAGKLREAREKLALCVSSSCPGVVREDCAQRLTDVDAAMPSIVFEAKDGTGHDLVDVTVTMDGQVLADRLTGLPLQINPGAHQVVFEAQGLPRVEETIVIREGEHDRRERVVLGRTAGGGVSTPPAPPATPGSEDSGQRMAAYALSGVGVVGLVIGGVFGLVSKSTYDHALQTECGNNPGACSTPGIQDGKTAHTQAAISTAAFIVGAAGLGAGAVLYFTLPRSSVRIGAAPGGERAMILMSGRW